MEIMTPKRLRMTIKTIRAIIFISIILGLFLSTIIVSILLYAKAQGPPSLSVPQSTVVFAGDGSILGETHHGQKRFWVDLHDISPHVLNATIAIEDKSFYEHHGFDYKRIVGAAIADLKAMAKVQGASTITQQYARNLFLEHDKTWKRKIQEALYTIRLEMSYSKEDILEGYLNTIYYGHGAYGIEAASDYYFGKEAKDLTLSEASLLAAIPKGPSFYSPKIHLENAKSRQKLILNEMVQHGYLSKKAAAAAYEEPLSIKDSSSKENVKMAAAPYFYDAVLQDATKKLNVTEQEMETLGLRIHTTIDPKLQELAENRVKQTISDKSEIQASFVAADPKTGYIKALVGGRNYKESPFNRATQAERQPGSTMKPFLYYAAVKSGMSPSTPMRSEPTTFTFNDGESTYKPSNFNNYYANDSITLAQAIAMSDNVYAVKTHLFLGMQELIDTSKEFGITSKLAKVPSLALGTAPVKLYEMVNAYGILANGGKQIEPTFITKIEDSDGNTLYEHPKEAEQILDNEAAFVTTHLMTGMFDKKLNGYTTVTGQTIADSLTRKYAGKSGTTETDSWMIGYSPQLVAGVWTGYDKGKTIDVVAEKSYAKNIWASFMEEALEDEPAKSFKPPKGVVGIYINPETGKLATKDCPVRHYAYYVAGTEPTEYCTDHLDSDENDSDKGNLKDRKDKEQKWWQRILPWG
ncbi:transglycosylase domain-containing protein [Metabacillus arenae]|uniref:PBP1A family penicillin-binding protein n=1 Tax=Metabacillus arenae TaxID=2771434 RepID=A0A926NFS6_9BACI|nr:PBP1A family penicillin-binding protein [Metabacillus arenae]MBD1379708.1 PBP1A family penicillin-binding protein [Metabacillus arenae]